MIDLHSLFAFEHSILHLLIRGTVVYWSLYLMFRVAGRRNIGSLGFTDIMVVMIVASAVGDSLSAGSTALLDGLIVAAVVIGWSGIIDRLCYFVPAINRLFEPAPVRLVEDGQILLRNMRAQYVTRGELMEQVRLHGLLSVGDVKLACLEANGEISVIPREPAPQP